MNRIADVAVSAIALAALAPVMLCIAVANRLLTGRVLFRQVRAGRGLRPFTMLKFQTMVDSPPGASTVTVAGDARVTRFGRILRATKLDELPQLVNVLRGEMSLVGPRALPPSELARIPAEVASLVYSVRPGMTGLASLLFADEERALGGVPHPEQYYFAVVLPRKMAIESAYVRRKRIWVDLLILAATPLALVLPGPTRRVVGRLMAPDGPTALAKESA